MQGPEDEFDYRASETTLSGLLIDTSKSPPLAGLFAFGGSSLDPRACLTLR